jgi:hypothetical protein
VRVVENVHLFADRWQPERSDARGRVWIRNVDDLQPAELVEKVKGVPGPLLTEPENVCGALGLVALISAKFVCPPTTFEGG